MQNSVPVLREGILTQLPLFEAIKSLARTKNITTYKARRIINSFNIKLEGANFSDSKACPKLRLARRTWLLPLITYEDSLMRQ